MQERVTRTNKYSSLRTQLKVEKKAHYKKVGKLTVISVVVVFAVLITGLVFIVVNKLNS